MCAICYFMVPIFFAFATTSVCMEIIVQLPSREAIEAKINGTCSLEIKRKIVKCLADKKLSLNEIVTVVKTELPDAEFCNQSHKDGFVSGFLKSLLKNHSKALNELEERNIITE